ncbi:hypothetical protein bcgnr5369_57360 [Bacillus cereus]|uniref:Uncharacterized protein n=1 Tax=Bacillus thuringiensis TaxID=1428 RepID=A0A9X6WI02_BACTU|nr:MULTISPECIES: hypothetical protein [Bacillus cereus group]PFJ29060.1 hypothetical protein COJ15_32875 [Bacillus thuringiensis]PGP14667.1 hypothetical protein COA01_30405 [Bacillus cereus]
MMGTRFVRPGQEVFAINSGKIVKCVFLNRTGAGDFELRSLPHYSELIVSTVYGTAEIAQQALTKSSQPVLANSIRTSNHRSNVNSRANSYAVCEQCGSVTSAGKGCECSRWA